MSLGNIHLTPQLVQAVRDAVDIVEVASDQTRLKRSGKRYLGLCPLHKEKTPSFSVDPAQGLFYCFGCGAGGDAIKLHMLLHGDDFPAAIEALAMRYGIPLPSARERRGGKEGADLEAVLEEAAGFFREQLERSAEPRRYLERRQMPQELIERYGLGYAPPGWTTLLEALHPRIPLAELEAAGLIGRSQKSGDPYDRFRHRLVFPIRTPSGRLVGFGGRTLGDDRAKYINTAETERFSKGRLLYGLDQAKRAIRESGRVLLVEGYFDVLGAAAAGIEWVVASMGTALTPEQARLLARYSDEVVVGYDADRGGEESARRALPILLAEGLAVRRPELPEGHDPDSLRLAEGAETVRRLVEEAEDAVVRELDRLAPSDVHRQPRRQAEAARAVAAIVQRIPDSILRYGYGRMAAERLGVPVELLWRRLGVDAEGIATGQRAATEGRRLVLSLEERVLQLLLTGRGRRPAAAELPPAEVFLDEACRNIYRAFCALYEQGSDRPPEARAVLARLAESGEGVDRVAQLLLEEAFAPRDGELVGALRELERRWRRQRLRELAGEIQAAQRAGDQERLERLLNEKTELSRSVHSLPGG